MYNNQVFSRGVGGVLKGSWKLVCETPLVIRNGLQVSYSANAAVKTRNKDVRFAWRSRNPDNRNEFELAGLHYGYEIEQSKVLRRHFVPASSVRGALRSWTINHLVERKFHSQLTPPPAEETEATEKYSTAIHEALASPQTGYPLVASLFGLAFDSDDESGLEGNASRLHFETERFTGSHAAPIAINGPLPGGDVGPDNARREMTVRNPLDRITHASKEGGLHHFLEFCKGETFGVRLTILNPCQSDLGLISLWVREMNAGFLRFGALSSIGRGRVRVQEQSYQLWQIPGAEAWTHFTACTMADPENEALAGFWNCNSLPDPEKTLPEFEQAVVEVLGG